MSVTKDMSAPKEITIPNESTKSKLLIKIPTLKKKIISNLFAYSIDDFAKQLTLIEFKYFANINIREFLDLNWMKKEKKALSPGITQFTDWSNHVSFWVMTEILQFKSAKERAETMEYMICIAQVNNFILKI